MVSDKSYVIKEIKESGNNFSCVAHENNIRKVQFYDQNSPKNLRQFEKTSTTCLLPVMFLEMAVNQRFSWYQNTLESF